MFAMLKALLEVLGLAPHNQVRLSVSQGRLIADPHPRPRYRLAELLAQCDLSATESAEDRTW